MKRPWRWLKLNEIIQIGCTIINQMNHDWIPSGEFRLTSDAGSLLFHSIFVYFLFAAAAVINRNQRENIEIQNRVIGGRSQKNLSKSFQVQSFPFIHSFIHSAIHSFQFKTSWKLTRPNPIQFNPIESNQIASRLQLKRVRFCKLAQLSQLDRTEQGDRSPL